MSLTEARAALSELLDRVAAGDEIVITRHGRPAAVLVRPDALRVRRAAAERALAEAAEIEQLLERAREVPLDQRPTISRERADELVAAIRRDRDDD